MDRANRPLLGVTVVFDLDGTIADTAPDLIRATNEALVEGGFPRATETAIKPAVGYGALAMVAAALHSHGINPDQAVLDSLTRRMVEFYEGNIAKATALFAGAEAAFDALAADGARLAICTNKMERLARKLLHKLNVLQRFDALAGGDTYLYRKPDPRHILMVIEAAKGSAERALMVGDSEADIGAAKAAGIPSIAVSFGYSSIPPQDLGADAVIEDFSLLLDHARNLLAR